MHPFQYFYPITGRRLHNQHLSRALTLPRVREWCLVILQMQTTHQLPTLQIRNFNLLTRPPQLHHHSLHSRSTTINILRLRWGNHLLITLVILPHQHHSPILIHQIHRGWISHNRITMVRHLLPILLQPTLLRLIILNPHVVTLLKVHFISLQNGPHFYVSSIFLNCLTR